MANTQISSFGDVSDPVGVHMSQKVIYTTRKNMVYNRFAYEEEIPKGESTTLKFMTWGEFTATVAPLVQSVTPQGEDLAPGTTTATLQLFGKWTPLVKAVVDTVSCPILNNLVDRLAYNQRLSFETFDFYTYRLGSNVIYSGTANSRATVSQTVRIADIENAVAELEADNIEPITEMIHPVPDYGAVSVPECYIATCHSYVARSIRRMPGFQEPKDYADPDQRLPMEIGKVDRVRFISHNVSVPWAGANGSVGAATTAVKNTGGYADVYPILIFGKDAIGMSKLAGTEFNKIMVVNPKPSPGNELGLVGSAGWVGWHAAKILDQSKMIRIECAASLTGAE